MPGRHGTHRVLLSVLVLTCLSLVLPLGAQTWTQLAPTGGPPETRAWASAILDPTTNKMIMFSGTHAGSNLNDVWSLSTTGSPQWTQLLPAGTPPSVRLGQSAVYDSTNSRIIMFGGGTAAVGIAPCANDVWVLSNANSVSGTPTWTQLSPTGGPPAPRIYHTAVYNQNSNSMIVFGGSDCATPTSQFYNDVWVLSNANGLGGTPAWTQLSLSGGPPVRLGATAVYDPSSNRMTVFGGYDVAPFSDVWVLSNANGLGGTPAWTQLSPGGAAIPPRDYHSAIYDPASNRMTVFGGVDVGELLSDVWTLSSANGMGGTPFWTQLPSTSIPAREATTTVYDAVGNRMIVFGGISNNGYVNETWALSGANGIGAPPTPVSVTPSSGLGLQQTFALQYADLLGATDLSSVWVWITANFNPAVPSCLLEYARAANQLYLYNDAGTGWLAPATPGAAGTLGNSQCSINMAAATVTTSGTNLTLSLPVTFTAAYAGAKTTYMYAGGSNAVSGWQTMGSWTVPSTSGPPTTVSVTPASGSGIQQTFAFQYADPLGATDLTSVWVWITSNFNAAVPSCLLEYATAANQLYLYNDAGTGWLAPATPGAAGTLSNSQCSINMAAATVAKSGTNLTLNLPVTFTTAYAGAKTTYMYAGGSSLNSGWQTMGSWTVPSTSGPPTTVSATPSSGSGFQQTFAFQYSDPLGATDLTSTWVWITSIFNASVPSCLLEYARAANQLYLYNDAGTGWLAPATPGAAGTLSNSQCSINMAAATVTTSGTNLTLNLPMTFTAAYAGAKTTYMYAGGSSLNSGWQTKGSWTVPSTSGPPTVVSVTPSSGSGLVQTFALQYADPLGATDLTSVWVWITANFTTAVPSCLLEYATAANQLYLYNDAGTAWLPPATPGAAGTLGNSQCSINMAAVTVTKSGTNLTLSLPVTFTAAYAGAKTTYMYAGGSNANSGWQTMGSWNP
jgi:hypothetical protein